MALFFFVVGLEIKREVVHGELADRRVAALPVFAAVGGMVVPALLVRRCGRRRRGRSRVGHPDGDRHRLRARRARAARLAGAVVAEAVPAHAGDRRRRRRHRRDRRLLQRHHRRRRAGSPRQPGSRLSLVLRRLRVDWSPIYVALAVATWYATYRSGVHATIAGVALALTTPDASAGAGRHRTSGGHRTSPTSPPPARSTR